MQNWTISEAKSLFEQGLSDTQQLEPCRSAQREDIIVPEAFDWRELHPECARESANQIDKECPASYVETALSAVEDRVCAGSKGERVKLSRAEVLDCDKSSKACKGGTVNRPLTWGKRKGFITEECYKPAEEGVCPEDHLMENECRLSQEIYKVVDLCLAKDVEGIKREILANGPVIAQLNPYTDFLTYSEGVY